jgi:hypothetical protein
MTQVGQIPEYTDPLARNRLSGFVAFKNNEHCGNRTHMPQVFVV